MAGLPAPIKVRLDSFMNAFTGLGGVRDKSMSATVSAPEVLTQVDLENLFAGDDMARKITTSVVTDGMREGVTVEGPDANEVNDEIERLDAWALFTDAAIWGRHHGGGFLLMGLADGLQDKAVDVDAIPAGSLKWLMDLDRWAVTPVTYYSDPKEANFGEPETYRITPPSSAAVQLSGRMVHESRLLRFGGADTSARRRAKQDSYDDSVLTAVFDILRDTNTIWRSGVASAQDMSQGVFKIRNYVEMLANGSKDAITNRMELTDMIRSTSRALVLDAEMEEFDTVEAKGLQSFPGLCDKAWQRLAAAAEMPVTRLMGTSPAGFDATGASDIQLWYDRVGAWQEDRLIVNATILANVIRQSAGVSTEITVSFPPLWQRSAKDEADLRKTVAETDKLNVETGLYEPEEIAASRYVNGVYSMEMSALDPTLHETLAKIAQDEAKAAAESDDTGDDVAAVSMNGAQVKAIQDIMISVSAGEIPKDAAAKMIAIAFPVDMAKAEDMLSSIEEGGSPPAAPAPAFGGAPPFGGPPAEEPEEPEEEEEEEEV